MFLYLLTRKDDVPPGACRSAVVIARDKEKAKRVKVDENCWTTPGNLDIEYLGIAKQRSEVRVVCKEYSQE